MQDCIGVYLDHASTSFPKAPGVGEAMMDYINNVGSNINRGSYDSANRVSLDVLEARERLCRLFSFDHPEYALFTPGNTQAINQVLFGLTRPGGHVLTTAMEHNAVMRPLEALKERGVTYTCLPADEKGCVDPDDIKKYVRPNTRLMLMQHASNVSGTLHPVEQFGQVCRELGIPLVLDAAQTAGHIPVDFKAFNLSALCVPGHKGLRGPQGIGALLIAPSLARELRPLVYGGTGSQSDSLLMPPNFPDHLEAGTPNLPGIYGLSAALDWLLSQDMAALHRYEMSLCRQFMQGVIGLPGVRLVGPEMMEERVAVVSLDFSPLDNALITDRLQQEVGLCLRCGLHCAPLAHQSLGTYPQGSVRFSFSHTNTFLEVARAVQAVKAVVSAP